VRSGARTRRVFALGWMFGLAWFLVGMHWMLFLSDVAIEQPWLKYPAWLLGAAYLALYPGLALAWTAAIARRGARSIALTLPFVWLVVEGLRGAGELGFPWFQPGYTQYAYASLIQMASVGGIALVTAWVLALNVLLWRAWRGEARLRAAIGAVLLFALPLLWGQRTMDAAPAGAGPRVALVQANIPGEIKWSGEHQEEILAAFLDLSRAAAVEDPRPDVIIWPETATGSYLSKQSDQADSLGAFVRATGVPVYAGYADYGFDAAGIRRYANASGMFTGDGPPDAAYAKRHLVPFGERMPFQRLIPALGRMQLGQAEWTPGREAVLLTAGGAPFSALICFESIFPRLAREDVRDGARWLVNITNDEWLGNSAALYQHAAMARFRAVENHVPLARCANTGLTLVIDGYGRVVDRLPVFEPAVLAATLPAPGPRTWFNRAGDWPTALALVVVLGWSLAASAALLTRKTRAH
jgi:apolipoprotein N-acyltransferase